MTTVEERIKNYKKSKAAGSTSVPAFSAASAKNTVEDRIRQYKLEKKIGFDTFQEDLASASDLVNTVYGGWQNADTMGSAKNTISSMRGRLNAYKAYTNSYSRDTDLTQFNSGIDQLIGAYDSALSDWDSIAGTYSNFVNASAYDKAKKNYELSQKYAGLDYKGVQEAILQNPEDKEFLSQYGVNVGYSDLREYNRDLLGTAKKITEASGAEKDVLQKYLKKMKAAKRVYALDHKFDLYKDLMSNEDFEELSVYQPKQKKGIQIFPNKDEDEYDLVNDSAQKNFNAFNDEMFNTGVPMNKYNFEQMTTDEVAVYNYLYHKDRVEGTDTLDAYKKDMQIVWNKRATEASDKRIEKLADDSVLASIAMTAESIPKSVFGGSEAALSSVVSKLRGEEINPYSFAYQDINKANKIRSAVGSNIAEATQGMEIAGVNVPGFLYDVGLSVADSAVGIALLGKGYTVAASMGAAAQRAKELKEQGASEAQIIMGSAASGIAEAFFEKFSIDNLLKVKNADTIGKLVKETMKQMGIEASEEVFTELANIVSDILIRGDLSDAAQTMSAYMNQGYSEKEAIMKVVLDLTKDVTIAGIGGAISGGVMGGAKGASEYAKYNSTGKTITGNNRTDVLADIAKMSEDKNIQEYLKLLNEDKASQAQIGSLYAQVARELDADKRSKIDASKRGTIASRLAEIGENSTTAQNTADAIYKYLFPDSSTEKLTAGERATLKTENAKKVISEIKNKADWFLYSEMSQEAQEAIRTRNRLEDVKQPKSETKVKAERRAAEMNTGAETVDSATKERISIEGIRTDENGNTILKTSAGERGLEDVTLTESDAEIVAMAEGMESDKANLFVSMYTQGVNTEDYKDSFDLAYIYGVNAYGVESVIKNRGVLTARQTAAVYKLGIQNSTAETQARIDRLTKKHNTGIQAGKFNDSAVDYKKLNKRQQAAVAFVKMFSEKTGINVEFFESTADENGRRTMENGRFDKSTNTIYMDVYAGLNENIFEDSIISTLSHELTHWLQDKAPEAYGRLSGVVMNMLSKDRKASPEVLIAAEQSRYQRAHGEEISEEYARDELIARTCEDMLSGSGKVTEYLSHMDEKTAKTIGSRLKEAIGKLKAWISDLLRAYKSSSTEAKILRKYSDTLMRIQKVWDEAFEKAVMANQALRDEATSESKTKLSAREYTKNQFGLDSYSVQERENWKNGNIIVADSPADIVDFIKKWNKTGEYKRLYCGKIGKDLASRIENDTGVNLENYNIAIRSDYENSHADIEREKLRGQIAITPEVLSLFPTVVSEYDTVSIEGTTQTGDNVALMFVKDIKGKKVSVTYVARKRMMLYLQTMYGWGEKKNPHPAINASNDTSTTTPEAVRDMDSSKNSVSQNQEKSSVKFSDRDNTNLKEYTEEQRVRWKNSKSIIIYENDAQLLEFVRDSAENLVHGKKMYFGMVSDYVADMLCAKYGVDVHNYNCSLKSDEVRKILKDHGTEETELPRGQVPVRDFDFLQIPYVMSSPSSVSDGGEYNGKPLFNFKKDGITVCGIVSDKRLDLFVQTMYVQKNRSLATAIDEQASINTSETTSGTASNNIIPQNQEKSSVKFSERENIDLEAELATYNLDGKWNDYIGIQKNVIGKLRKEGFFEDNEVINKASGMVIRITAKGIKEILGNGNRFQTLPKELKMLKVATIRSLPEIIQNGMLKEDNVANLHGENELFAYINSQAIVDGEEYGVRVSIKKKIGANLFWIHNIDCDKKSPELLNLRAQGRGNYETQNSEDSIQQSGEKVNINFSERETESIYDAVGELQRVQGENEKIREDIERLRQKNRLERTLAGGNFFSESHLKSITEHILEKADSSYSKESLLAELKDIYGYLQREDVEWDIFMTKVTDTAQRIIADRKGKPVPNDYAKNILSMLRNTKVLFNDAQRAEAEYAYGKGWQRNYFGKVAVTREGIPLDTAWKEWAGRYPDMFDADISSADMATEVLYAYDVARAASGVVEAYDKSEAARNISFEIYNQFWNAVQVNGISDKDSTAIKKLKYEHRVAIKELRERYLERYYVENRNMKALYQQTIKNLLQKRDEDIAHVREYTKEYKEKLEKRSQIDKITKKSLKLNTWLVKNSKEAHVAEILKKPVAAILKSLNFSSERLLGIQKGKHAGEPTRKDISLSKAFEHLRDTVSSINDAYVNEDTVNDFYGYIDMPPDFAEFVNKMSGQINDILREVGDNEYILNRMSTEQLKDINKLLTTLTRMVTSANKAFAGAHGKTITELAEDTIAYADQLGAKSKFSGKIAEFFNFDNALPIYTFERFGDAAQKIFEGLQDGWDKLSFHVKQITEYAENAYTAKEVREWSEESHEFELSDGVRKDTVQITAAQIMSLYCLQKREQAADHLLGCGIRVKDFKDGRKTISQPKGATLTESDIRRMAAELTPRQREVADMLQSFMNTVCSEWGNEVSMVRFGYKMFDEENYFPIMSDKNQHANDTPKESAGSLFRLLNMSFTRSLTKGANSRVMIDNIFDVFAAHTSDMAKYNALALPVLDAFKWHSYHKNIEVNAADKEDRRKIPVGVKQSLEHAYGEGANRYITRFLEDLNGANSGGMTNTEKFSRKLMSNSKIAAVGANIRVAILQPTSYVRASAVIAPKYLVKAFTHRPQIQKAKDTCGMAQWKSMGFYSTNISKGVAALIKHEETWVDKWREGSMKLAELGDSVTWGYLYNACEAEVSDMRPELSGEEKDEAVAKRLREVIYKTQVVDSTMTRTQTMRTPSTMSQMLTSFMSEAMVSYNLLHGLCVQFNTDRRISGSATAALKKNGRNILRATMAYLVTSLCSAFAGGFIDTLRDDEEDTEFGELFFANVQDNALSDIVSMLPLMRDLVSVYKGYGSERMDMQGLESAVKATKKLMKSIENREITYSAVYSAVKTASQLSGLPGSNFVREFKTIWNNTVGEVYESMKME